MSTDAPDRRSAQRQQLALAALIGLALACLHPETALVAGQPAPPPLTIERLAGLPSLIGTPPSEPVWSPDSARVAFLWNDRGMPFRDVWVVDAAAGPPRRLTRFGERPQPAAEGTSLAALTARAAARAAGGVSSLAWTPDGRAVIFSFEGDVHRAQADGSGLTRLTQGGGASRLGFSPDGRYLSFLRTGDLWLWRVADGVLLRATNVSVPPIGVVPNGRFNAFDVSMRAYAWSPDSRRVALSYVDLRGVRRVPFPDYLAEETATNVVRRGYPGDEGEDRRVAVYSVGEGLTRFVDLPERTYRSVIGYQWSPDGASLLVEQDSDDAETRWLYVVHGSDLSARQLWRDHRARRIYAAFTSSWRSDGGAVLFICDQDYYRLCSIPTAGGTPARLTEGPFDVAGTRGAATVTVNRATRQVYFVSSQKNPYERQVYRMAEGGGPISAVTTLEGVHEPVVSPDGARVALLHASDLTPTDLYLLDTRVGSAERRVTHSPLSEFSAYPWSKPRYVTFRSRSDRFTLHARLTLPPAFDPNRRYPVVVGTVYSNTVRNEWRTIDQSIPQFLALERGYISLQVDLRGSIGYGVDFRETFQGDWGGGDLEDLHSAVEYLRTLSYVDPERIGLWGTSYGGMMVLFALFERPGLFMVGVAGAPAIEVARFTRGDQHLSRRPNSHPDIFRKSTLLNYGEKLQDPLLIIQGLQDDIVPFKTTVMMAEKLMLLGKDFDLAIAPRSSHVWTERESDAVFMVRKMVQFLDRHLR